MDLQRRKQSFRWGSGVSSLRNFKAAAELPHSKMIVVVDYEAGNLHNVGSALRHLGADFVFSDDPAEVSRADKIILPGVGSARAAMDSLARKGLVETLKTTTAPFLGICLGLQLLFERSEEDSTPGLGVLPGRVRRFDEKAGKVPHMGWNQARPRRPGQGVWRGVPDGSYFYFVHGYYAPVDASTLAETEYSARFASAAGRDNFQGVQFHPELSGDVGLRLLRNFLEDG